MHSKLGKPSYLGMALSIVQGYGTGDSLLVRGAYFTSFSGSETLESRAATLFLRAAAFEAFRFV